VAQHGPCSTCAASSACLQLPVHEYAIPCLRCVPGCGLLHRPAQAACKPQHVTNLPAALTNVPCCSFLCLMQLRATMQQDLQNMKTAFRQTVFEKAPGARS
jgi:hypothetical protein